MNGLPLERAGLPPRLDERWLRALVIDGGRSAAIRKQLEADALPPASDRVLDAIRTEFKPPPKFQPSNRSHGPSLLFVCRAQVEPFYRPDSRPANAALALLRDARARELTEAAAIMGVPTEVVAKMLAALFSVTTTTAAITLFTGTFFDTSVLTQAQLRLAVEERVRLSVLSMGEQSPSAVRRAVTSDPRMLALTLPRTPSAWDTILLGLGHMPARRELNAQLAELEQLTLVRAGQALMRGGRDDERRAESYANVLGKLRAIGENVADPNEGVIKALEQLRIRSNTERIPTVRELIARGDEVGSLEMGPAEFNAGEEKHR